MDDAEDASQGQSDQEEEGIMVFSGDCGDSDGSRVHRDDSVLFYDVLRMIGCGTEYIA
jgi:hypothetical protein